jgi:hypothetical protein
LDAFGIDLSALGLGEVECEEIENREPGDGKEDDELFFAIGHEEENELRGYEVGTRLLNG